jgi:hypothetical protein
MARYLCEREDARHSPVQDCESTFWLLIWSLAFIALKHSGDEWVKTTIKNDIIKPLRPEPWTLQQSAIGKKTLLAYLRNSWPSDLPAPFLPFVPLLKEMANLVTEYHDRSETIHKALKSFTPDNIRNCILRYLKLIYNNPIAVTDWGYIKEGEEKEKEREKSKKFVVVGENERANRDFLR